MITELPWQLWIILGEVWLSAVIGSFVVAKPYYDYTLRNVWWALSDLGIIALLIWGGSPSWQHLIFGTLYGWAIFNRVRLTRIGKRREIDTKAVQEHPVASTLGLVIMATSLTLLVVTG